MRRINNKAYELDFTSSYNMSHTFNVGDLSPFGVGFANLWLNSLQEGEDDESITPHKSIEDLPRSITRSMTIWEAFNPSSPILFSICLCCLYFVHLCLS